MKSKNTPPAKLAEYKLREHIANHSRPIMTLENIINNKSPDPDKCFGSCLAFESQEWMFSYVDVLKNHIEALQTIERSFELSYLAKECDKMKRCRNIKSIAYRLLDTIEWLRKFQNEILYYYFELADYYESIRRSNRAI